MKHTSTLSRNCFIAFILLLYCIFVSWPILQAGFYADDSISSNVRGMLAFKSQTLLEFCNQQFLFWFNGGRIFPIAIYASYLFHYIFPGPRNYQIVHVCLLWLSVFSAAWLVKVITKNIYASLLFIFLIPLFWTISGFHVGDALTSYPALPSLIVMFSTLALAFFIQFDKKNRIGYLFLSATLYTCALLTYEIGIVVLFSIFAITGLNQKKGSQKFFQVFPFILITCIYFFSTLYLRVHYPIVLYDGVELGPLNKVWITFAKQLTAPLPLSYWLLFSNPSPHLHSSLQDTLNQYTLFQFIALISVFFLSMLSILYLLPRLNLNKKQKTDLLWLGSLFSFIPSLLIGVSSKYQNLLKWGYGYLPVFLQYMGVCMILLVLLTLIKRNKTKMVCSALISVVICMTIILNTYTVNKENESFKLERKVMEDALHAGLFTHLPSQAVLISNLPKWNTPYFYMQNANIKIDVLPEIINNKQLFQLLKKYPKNFTYFINAYHPAGFDTGYVIVGKLKTIYYRLTAHNPEITAVAISNPCVFMSMGSDNEANKLTIESLQAYFLKIPPVLHFSLENQFVQKKNSAVIFNLPKGTYIVRSPW